MKNIKIGIICPSEIAFRRFMPAVTACSGIEYVGVAHASAEEWFGKGRPADKSVLEADYKKTENFQSTYGGKIFDSYGELIRSPEIDAVYLPLPPALHYKWGKYALENGKHLFLEKPSTTSAEDTKQLIGLAKSKNLALHENYMFIYHRQIAEIKEIINSGRIGDVRLYRIAFGFPMRGANDFRYNKALGGGALLDCGGYTVKLACDLLGSSTRIACSNLNTLKGFEVDIYGTATLVNDSGVTAQVSFGMDNSYKCELEVWGSKGCIKTGRILTAPAGFVPEADITVNGITETVKLSADDTFTKSILHFCDCVNNNETRLANYKLILKQAELVDIIKGDN